MMPDEDIPWPDDADAEGWNGEAPKEEPMPRTPAAEKAEAEEAAKEAKAARAEALKARKAEVTQARGVERPVLIETKPDAAEEQPVPVLHLGVTAILAGEGGVGKTAAAAGLAVAVAAGVPWLTASAPLVRVDADTGVATAAKASPVVWQVCRVPDATGGVLIVAAEEEHAEIHRRLRSACWEAARALVKQSPSLAPPNDEAKKAFDAIAQDVVANVQIIALADTAAEGAVLAEVVSETLKIEEVGKDGTRRTVRCEKADLFHAVAETLTAPPRSGKPWRLVILDPLVELLALESENDNRQVAGGMRAGVHPLRRLVKEAPVTVLALHHTSKGGGEKAGGSEADRVRGASAFVNSARWAALLTRDRETQGWVNLEVVKANYAARPGAILVNHKGALRGLTADEALAEATRRVKAAADKPQKRGGKPPKAAPATAKPPAKAAPKVELEADPDWESEI